jgi:hypothetical protein
MLECCLRMLQRYASTAAALLLAALIASEKPLSQDEAPTLTLLAA